MEVRITSTANPRIKALADLKERKVRVREGKFLIEGAREIERAIGAGFELELLLAGERLNPEEQAVRQNLNLETLELSDAPFSKVSSRENPAGLIAVAKIPNKPLSSFKPTQNALVLVAVGLEKPGNVGAVLRSADAAGANALVAVGGVDLYNPQVIRNSTGVVFSLPTFTASEEEALEWLEQHAIPLVATTPHTEQLYWDADLRGAVAIAVGPEHEGLSKAWLEAARQKVRIPMQGSADSLNVSVSAALLLYEAFRQRK